jgi:signal peptidase I
MTPYSHFKETHVSENQLFVIGDNLPNSFDSRVDRFEPVTTDKVIGRPVLIYWSTDSSRIGCPIH